MHGWIILDKPLGLGSTQAVAAVKRNLREAGLSGRGKDRAKVGHGGTLDPLATGILPIAIGEATKLTGRLLDASKVYDFTIAFGSETDTLDAEGKIIAKSDRHPTLAEVEGVLFRFTGPIEQVPPAYSALKVDGRRAYDRARAGEVVELKTRAVTVFEINACYSGGSGDLQETAPDSGDLDSGCRRNDEPLESITLSAHVSKGTYIRSLARDIAHALDTVGHVTMLRRTRAGPFGLNRAISLDKLNEIGKGAPLEAVLLPLEAGLADIPALHLTPDQVAYVRVGRPLDQLASEDGLYLARDVDGVPLALMELAAGTARVVRGFNI